MNQLWQEMEKEFSKQWEEPSQENNCCVPATVGKFMGMAQSKEKVVQNEVWRNKARSCRPNSSGRLLDGFEQRSHVTSLVPEKDFSGCCVEKLKEESRAAVQTRYGISIWQKTSATQARARLQRSREVGRGVNIGRVQGCSNSGQC